MAPIACRRPSALSEVHPLTAPRRSSVAAWLAGVAMTLGLPGLGVADPFPPTWGPVNEAGGPVHFAPVPWPNEPANPADCGTSCGDWKPYSRFQNSLNDPRVRDPSNGGTAPQNYVNVASSCIDTSFPSIYYNLRRGLAPDGSEDVILFRWRVEQIANTYATGPSPGNFGATDPWNSALWTVFFDIDGDGFRDLAAHLNGSSGSPSEPIDMIAGIWGNIPTQSLDYLNDPNIKLIAHNPTGFVSGSRLLNFQNSLNPSTDWGTSPRSVWDYGTTRSRLISTNACNEYFIDYQIPVRMLDASPTGPNPALNGPKITRSTPISMMFCSANSLNNPTQKDCAVNNTYTSGTPVTGPFGDYLSFDQDQPYAQPIISSVTATAPNTCPGPYRLSARVQDTLALQSGSVVSSVKAVEFFYWFDANANGEADEAGGRWNRISAPASLQAGSLNTWNASWDATGLPRGAYLVGVQAVDDRARVDFGMSPAPRDNRTFSYATGNAQGQVYLNGAWVSPTVQANFPLHQPAQNPVATEDWFGNPEVTGQQIAIVDVAINACGESPSLSKTATPASIATGELVSFTVTLANTTSTAITLAQIEDALPPGFQFESTGSLTNDGVALVPSTQPSAGATGSVAWTFPDVSVLAGRSVVLSFQARAGPTAGTYTNLARAQTSSGALDSPPASVGVDAARLSLSKTPDRFAVNPDGSTVVEYTLRWANDSAVSLTAASITDPLPAGTTYVGCSGGSSCGFSAPDITWQLGNLAPGASGEVRLRLTVNTNYASPSLLNTASFSATPPGGGSASSSASSTIAVNVPVPAFTLEKSSSTVQVAPGGSVTWTLAYRNYGTGPASGVVLTDDLPDGFSFASCSVAGSTHFSPCSHANGVVTFNAASVPAGGSGSVSITVNVAGAPFPFANPATNSASLTWTGNPTPVQATDTVGVTGQACSLVNYLEQGGALSPIAPPTAQAGSLVSLFSTNTAVFDSAPFTSPVPLAGRVLSLRAYIDAKTASADLNIVVDRVLVGGAVQNITTFNANPPTAPQIYQFNSTAFSGGTPDLAVGERLRLTFQGTGSNVSNRVELFFGGTQTFNGASTYTDSLASVCTASSPAALDVSKRVDQANLTSLPAALQYTIDVSNPGGVNATGAVLTDTLPSGVNLVSVVLNGTTVVPTPTVTGQQFSLPVNSVGQASGVIAAGGLGTVVVNATATASASGSLINTASLSATGLGPVVDTATTVVGVPGSGTPAALNLSKSVSPGLLSAGDTATFRLSVVNTGGTAASGVVVSDDFPDQAWFTYVDCTAPAGDTCSESPAGSLLWTVGTLLPGEAASLDFRMRVAAAGVPAGANALQNLATVSDPTYCTAPAVSGCTSNTVNLTVSGQPRLELDKTASPAGPYVAGDVITYTLVLRNTGASDASGVQVVDPVPAYTAYAGGLSASLGSGSFDAVDNRVVYSLNSLAAGATATLSFQARVVYPLPQGNTSITNTATASAANAASVQDSVTGTAVGTPVLTLDKQGAASVPYPAAILSAAASGTSIVVDSAQRLSVGGYVQVGGSVRRITAIAGRTVTLDGSVSAAAGAPVAASIEYALVYANEGDADASSVVLTDTLPANLVYAAASVTPSSAPPVGSAGALSFSLGTLEAGEVGQLQISAIPLAAGSYTNAASLSATGVATVNDSVLTQAGGLVVDKRTTTPVRSVGEQAEYVLSVRNTAPATISGITVTDPLPSGFTYDSTVHVRINGIDVVPLSSPGAGSAFPSWSSFAVPAGQTLEIRFLATVGPDVGPATYDNPLEVSAPGAAITPFDPLATPAEDVTVLAPDQGLVFGVIYADIDGNGSYDPAIDTPLPGAEVLVRAANGVVYIAYADFEGRYQRVVPAGSTLVSVAGASLPGSLVPTTGDDGENPTTVLVPTGGSAQDNNGFVPASGPVGSVIGRVFDDPDQDGVQDAGEASRLGVRVELRDAVSGAILFVTYTDLLGDYSFPNVPVGNYTVHVERPSGTGFSAATPNNPPVSVTDGGTAREDFGLIVALTVDADLSVSKSNGASSVIAGGSTIWTLVISNAGPSAADGATVFDPAVAGLSKTAVSCTGSSGGASCPPAPSVAALEAGTLAIPSLPVGGTVSLQVTANVTAAPGDTVVNTVSVSPPDGVTDPDPANNSASDSDPVEAPPAPELSLSKTASPSPFTVGEAASYTLQVSNTGTAATSAGITITDDVPASLALGTLPAGCTASGQTVTCTVAALAVGASSSFVIPVTPGAGAAPSVQNTASVSGGGDPGCPLAARCSSTITTPVNAPGLGFTKTANLGDTNSNGTADEGEVIAYTLTATNTGNVSLTNVSIADPRLPTLSCTPGQPTTLAPTATLVCTGSYTVTLLDIKAGVAIANTATAHSDQTTPVTATATVPITGASAALTLDKTAALVDTNSNTTADAGEVINYTLLARNAGNVSLTAVSISDPRLPSLTCTPAQPTTLLPGASLSCTGSYTVTLADIDAQAAISNTATATGTPPSGPALSSTDTATVPVTAAAPMLGLTKTANLGDTNSNGTADEGEVIAYTLTATNTGNVSLTNVSIADPRLPSLSCTPGQPTTLAPTATLVCTGSYTVTLLDIKAGVAIANTATADSDQTTPVTATATVPITGASAALTLDKTAALVDTNSNTTADAGEVINYTLLARNAGNVSLTAVSISDPRLPSLTCTPAQPTTLLPGASLSCTGSYTVTLADIDAQAAISNTATATGTPPSGPALSATDTATVPVTAAAPLLGFTKTANLGDTNSNGTADEGEVIAYTLTATNTGNVSLTNVSIADPRLPTLSCTPSQPTTLAPTATLVCTGSYTVTLLDIKAGVAIANTATADSDQTTPVTATATVPVTGASAALTLDKTAALVDTNSNTTADAGEVINYTLLARNAGNVSLTAVSISDPRLPSLTCTPAQPTTLLPGATLSCTGSYMVTQADIDAQAAISNTATATGTPPSGPVLTATDTALVPVTGAPAALAFDKTAALGDSNGNGTADVGEVIAYTLVAQNSGGVTLTAVSISDPRLPSLTCTPVQPTTLLPGATLSCTGSYTVTQADINAQIAISNTATATGTPPSGPALSATDTATVPVTAAAPLLGLTKTANLGDTNSNGTADEGEVIAYTLTATNTGNVSLTNVSIADPRLPTLSCTPSQPTTLAPTATLVCTGSYTVTLLDIKAGVAIANTATADSDQTTPVTATATVPITGASAALTLDKTAALVDGNANSTADVGELINYTLLARNAGNVSLTAVSISDPRLPSLTCTPAQPTTLLPGASLSCTGSYTVTQADIDAQIAISNTATATGTPPSGPVLTATDTALVPVTGAPAALAFDKTAALGDSNGNGTADVGEVIAYTLVAQNSGGVTLTAVSISDPRLPSLTCTPVQPTTLLPGATLSCTGSYTVTQADYDAQLPIVNTATASAQPPSGSALTRTDSASVPVTIAPPMIGVSKVLVAVSTTSPFQLDYRIRVRNFGRVPLSNVQVTDNLRQTFPVPVGFQVLAVNAGGGLTPNPGFDGNTQTQLLAPGGSLAVGAEAVIDLRVRVTLNGISGTFNNVAIASGSGPDGRSDSDDSVDGNSTDPDGNGLPDEQSPTPVTLRAPRPVAQIPVDQPLALLLLVLAIGFASTRSLRRGA